MHDSIEVLQEKWNLHVIRALLKSPQGFNQLQRTVGGVNTATLAKRLDALERLGIVGKEVESTMPPRTQYSLTEAGLALSHVINAIEGWATTHFPRCRAEAERRSKPTNTLSSPDT